MANAYNQWVATAPLKLPIETYTKAALVGEQRGEKNLQDLSSLYQQYGSVEGFSANAKASYDQAIGKLRTDVEGIAKMNLKNPEAYRKISALSSDLSISKPISDVYMDALAGQKAYGEYSTYISKNPVNNAFRHTQMFKEAANEKGVASEFNANRFSKLGPIAEYFDYYKLIADEVKALKADSSKLKEIKGQFYHTTTNEGVSEERIRELATTRVLQDPQARAQFERDVLYRGYLKNNTNPEQGVLELGQGYREKLIELKDKVAVDLTKGIEEINKIKVNPQTKKPISTKEREDAIKHITALAKRKTDFYDSDLETDNGQLAFNSQLQGFVSSFDSYGSVKTEDMWEYTPMAIAQFKEASANARLQTSLKAREKENQMSFQNDNTRLLTLTQIDPSPTKYNDYLKSKEDLNKSMPNVQLTNEGTFDKSSYNKSVKGEDGRHYVPNQVTTFIVDIYGKAKENPYDKDPSYKKIQTVTDNDMITYRYVKKENKGYKSIDEVSTLGYENAKKEIKNHVLNGGFYSEYVTEKKDENGKVVEDFNYQKAMADIITQKQSTERALMKGYSPSSWNSADYKEAFTRDMSVASVYLNGSSTPLSKDEVVALRNSDKFKSNFSGVFEAAYTSQVKGPSIVAEIGGNLYTMAMDDQNSAYLHNASQGIQSILNNTNKAQILGNDLIINKMRLNGETGSKTIPNGASAASQAAMQGLYQKQEDLLKSTGMSTFDAQLYVQRNAYKIDLDIANGRPHVVTHNDNTVELRSAAHKQADGGLYYVTSILDKDNKVQPTTLSYDSYLKTTMQKFQDPHQNIYHSIYDREILNSSRKTKTNYGGGRVTPWYLDDEED